MARDFFVLPRIELLGQWAYCKSVHRRNMAEKKFCPQSVAHPGEISKNLGKFKKKQISQNHFEKQNNDKVNFWANGLGA